MKDRYYYDLNIKSDIVVIGGGPAGIISAIQAAQTGARVILLERMDRVGKKLLATGNGKCNLSNMDQSMHHYHASSTPFVQTVFDHVNSQKSMDFLESLGLSWKSMPDGKVYPTSEQASSVLDILRLALAENNVQTLVKKEVTSIGKKDNQFRIRCKDLQELKTDAVILASGGRARPNMGSNGPGYKLSEQLGHTITPIFPAQVQICSDLAWLKSLKGLKQTCKATLSSNEDEIRSESGEILFTDYGLSGIPILQLSWYVHSSKNSYSIVLDFFPDTSFDDLRKLLKKRIADHPNQNISDIFLTWLHKRLVTILLKECSISREKTSQTLSDSEIVNLINMLKSWTLPVTGTKSWSEAQVTSGGISLNEINPDTLKSNLCPNLYFAGEILDIDGDCGGYNLQWAWSSGILAGLSAASNISERHLT